MTRDSVTEEHETDRWVVRVFEDGFVSVTDKATGQGFDTPGELLPGLLDLLDGVPGPERCKEMYEESGPQAEE